MKITFRGVDIELQELPGGKYARPNVAQFTGSGRGCTWLDDARIPTSEAVSIHDAPSGTFAGGEEGRGSIKNYRDSFSGRFPANLLVSDDVLNDGFERKKAGNVQDSNIGDYNATSYKFGIGKRNPNYYNDSGSYSRFFDIDAWWAKTFPFLIVPKAAKSEKNKGLENRGGQIVDDGRKTSIDNPFLRGETERKNTHPTVKPLKLMSYLITLGSRPGDVVLDPFLGSGTTAVAAKTLGRNYIGIEREKEYCEIAEARLKAISKQLNIL